MFPSFTERTANDKADKLAKRESFVLICFFLLVLLFRLRSLDFF